MLRIARIALAPVVVLLTLAPGASALELDPDFADRGVMNVPSTSEYSFGIFNDAVELSDGRFVAGGGFRDDGTRTGGPALMGFDASGELDPSFGGDGVVDAFFPTTSRATIAAVAETRGGRLVAIGDGAIRGHGRIFVAQFLPDGTLDPGFGFGGIRLIDVPESYERLAGRSLVVLEDGRIQFTIKSVGGRKWYSVLSAVRLMPDGSDDKSFGSRGRAALPPQVLIAGGSVSCPYNDCLDRTTTGMTVDAKGRTVLSSGYDGWRHRLQLGRLTPSGRVDRSFGRRGQVSLELDPKKAHSFFSIDAGPLVASPDGGVVVAAGAIRYTHGSSSGGGVLIARVDERGRLDRRFGEKGFTVFETSSDGVAADIERLPGGGYAVSGTAVYYPSKGLVGGLRPDGSPDPSFGEGGLIDRRSLPIQNALSLDADSSGALLVSGYGPADKAEVAVALHYLP